MQVTAASSVAETVTALNQPQYPAGVEAAARVITNHLACEESVAAPKRAAYTAEGAIPALLTACTTHLHHAGVVEQVCRAFSNLTYACDANRVCDVIFFKKRGLLRGKDQRSFCAMVCVLFCFILFFSKRRGALR